MKCVCEGCPHPRSMEAPKDWCLWHWQLWFNYGDKEQAHKDLRRSRNKEKRGSRF